MNNMRRGFTMIELIFVMAIIGILAAVAIPKMAGTATEAKKSTIISWIGSLNRTVGPAMWQASLPTGDVSSITTVEFLSNYGEIPVGVTLDLSGCNADGTEPSGTVTTAALPNTETIYCKNGTTVSSPKFGFAPGNGTSPDLNISFQNN